MSATHAHPTTTITVPTGSVACCCCREMIEHSKAILKRRGFTDRASVKEEVYWIPAK